MSSVLSPGEDSGQEEKLIAAKRKISLSSCAVCGSEESRYRCPACLTHSCSLLCVKKHKERLSCTGVRNKTAFVSLSQFDEMALLSDYRFLEDTGRFADGTNRDDLIRAPQSTLKVKKLVSCARKMNITLRVLPITFSKSRENSTFYLSKERCFLWHLKLLFPQSDAEFSRRRVSDRLTLEEILTPYIHPTESDPVTRQRLKMYVQVPLDHVRVFMKVEGRKANSVRYHELDVQKSLQENLSFKVLIEYPVLHVVLRDHWKDYPLRGPAEPASPCSSVESEREGEDREKGGVTEGSQSPPNFPAPEGTAIWTATSETNSDSEPPLEKRAKKESREEELEDGEIRTSDDEEGNFTPCGESDDGTKSHVEDQQEAASVKLPALPLWTEEAAEGEQRSA